MYPEIVYDNVPRNRLYYELMMLGCGRRFISMIKAIYSCARMVFKTKEIQSMRGVKQGASTSCTLFIAFVHRMIKMINNNCLDDGYLGKFHVLLLMDDTVLLATSRKELSKKFQIVCNFCRSHGMKITRKKTKFMVINKSENDRIPISNDNITVEYTSAYIYPGTPIIDDGYYKSVINMHISDKSRHLIKYFAFIQKNVDLPFSIKKSKAEACVLSSLLYGNESWLCTSYSNLETLYMKLIKSPLGARNTTCYDICLLESNMPSLTLIIDYKRSKYLQKKIPMLTSSDPLCHALYLVRSVGTSSYPWSPSPCHIAQ